MVALHLVVPRNATDKAMISNFLAIGVTGITNAKIDPEALYVGCYKDQRNGRALPVRITKIKKYSTEGITEQCINECKRLGHPYAGLQYSDQCYCGIMYNKYGTSVESKCDKKCKDHSGKMCGGHYKNSVYKTS